MHTTRRNSLADSAVKILTPHDLLILHTCVFLFAILLTVGKKYSRKSSLTRHHQKNPSHSKNVIDVQRLAMPKMGEAQLKQSQEHSPPSPSMPRLSDASEAILAHILNQNETEDIICSTSHGSDSTPNSETQKSQKLKRARTQVHQVLPGARTQVQEEILLDLLTETLHHDFSPRAKKNRNNHRAHQNCQ